MIAAYFISAVLGVVFFVASKSSLPMRLGLSIGIFLVIAVAVTVIITRVGDRAPPDAVTIDPKRLQDGGKSE